MYNLTHAHFIAIRHCVHQDQPKASHTKGLSQGDRLVFWNHWFCSHITYLGLSLHACTKFSRQSKQQLAFDQILFQKFTIA